MKPRYLLQSLTGKPRVGAIFDRQGNLPDGLAYPCRRCLSTNTYRTGWYAACKDCQYLQDLDEERVWGGPEVNEICFNVEKEVDDIQRECMDEPLHDYACVRVVKAAMAAGEDMDSMAARVRMILRKVRAADRLEQARLIRSSPDRLKALQDYLEADKKE